MKISDAYQSITTAFIDWKGFLINPRYCRNDLEITWENRRTTFIKGTIYESHILQMDENKQYTFQVSQDGSLFQIYYRYNQKGNSIQSASLGYYRAWFEDSEPITEDLLSETNVLPLDELQSADADLIGFDGDLPIGWLRIDYDPHATEKGPFHHDCHMHISNFPQTRFIVNGIPTPQQFVEFVIAACYPKRYRAHRLEIEIDDATKKKTWRYAQNGQRIDAVNSTCVPMPKDPLYGQLSHFRVPQVSK